VLIRRSMKVSLLLLDAFYLQRVTSGFAYLPLILPCIVIVCWKKVLNSVPNQRSSRLIILSSHRSEPIKRAFSFSQPASTSVAGLAPLPKPRPRLKNRTSTLEGNPSSRQTTLIITQSAEKNNSRTWNGSLKPPSHENTKHVLSYFLPPMHSATLWNGDGDYSRWTGT